MAHEGGHWIRGKRLTSLHKTDSNTSQDAVDIADHRHKQICIEVQNDDKTTTKKPQP